MYELSACVLITNHYRQTGIHEVIMQRVGLDGVKDQEGFTHLPSFWLSP